MRIVRGPLLLAFLLALAGCSAAPDPRHVDVAVVGTALRPVDPNRRPLAPADRIVLRETAVGLVTFDAAGQVSGGLAESWIVTEDGLSYLFRLRRMRWPDGTELTAAQVAQSLSRALAPGSRNPLRPLLSAVDSVRGMTGRVVEVRLRVPRPNLLQLLAQPELGIRRGAFGLGPWRAQRVDARTMTLVPAPLDAESDPEAVAPDRVERIALRAVEPAIGVARFRRGLSALFLGGTLADFPLVDAARVREGVRLDPVEGLFGLGVIPRRDLLKDRLVREAIAMTIDRAALVEAAGVPGWAPVERLLPNPLDSARPPAQARWAGAPLERRRAVAAAQIAAWRAANGPIEPLRIRLPIGPGMRLVLARLTADLREIGLDLVPATAPGDADLVLLDEVAPNASANWYLTRTGCEGGFACSGLGQAALVEARAAPSLALRAVAIARADAEYALAGGYIPIATPVRWSLVARGLDGWRENAFAAHPFAELRRPN